MGSRLTLPRQNAKISFYGHLLNPANRVVETRQGRTEDLTKTELEVLLDLLDANGEVVERQDFGPWRGEHANRD
jgi:DNA-binding winged helix-turn-helix (wHTH) protein